MIVSVRPSVSPGRASVPSSSTLMVLAGMSISGTGVGTGVPPLIVKPAVISIDTPSSPARRGRTGTVGVGVTVGVRVTVGVGVGEFVGAGVKDGSEVGVINGVTVGSCSVGVTTETAVLGSRARLAQPVMKAATRRRLIIGTNGCF